MFLLIKLIGKFSYKDFFQFVHRDLAARNIVVAGSGDEYTLKIADFGLAREINDGKLL